MKSKTIPNLILLICLCTCATHAQTALDDSEKKAALKFLIQDARLWKEFGQDIMTRLKSIAQAGIHASIHEFPDAEGRIDLHYYVDDRDQPCLDLVTPIQTPSGDFKEYFVVEIIREELFKKIIGFNKSDQELFDLVAKVADEISPGIVLDYNLGRLLEENPQLNKPLIHRGFSLESPLTNQDITDMSDESYRRLNDTIIFIFMGVMCAIPKPTAHSDPEHVEKETLASRNHFVKLTTVLASVDKPYQYTHTYLPLAPRKP